jgi:hypothetical protein
MYPAADMMGKALCSQSQSQTKLIPFENIKDLSPLTSCNERSQYSDWIRAGLRGRSSNPGRVSNTPRIPSHTC